MSLNAAALRLMQEKGLSLDDVVEIAAAMETRTKAAERQSRYRERKKRDVTRDVTPASLNDIYSKPPVLPLDISNEISPPIVVSVEPEKPNLKPEHVLEAWNDMANRCGLPKAKLTQERRRPLVSLIRRHTIEDFTEAIHAVERSSFCRGENGRGWRANIDFMLRPSNFTKLIEGTYDGTTQ